MTKARKHFRFHFRRNAPTLAMDEALGISELLHTILEIHTNGGPAAGAEI